MIGGRREEDDEKTSTIIPPAVKYPFQAQESTDYGQHQNQPLDYCACNVPSALVACRFPVCVWSSARPCLSSLFFSFFS